MSQASSHQGFYEITREILLDAIDRNTVWKVIASQFELHKPRLIVHYFSYPRYKYKGNFWPMIRVVQESKVNRGRNYPPSRIKMNGGGC